MNLPVRKLHQIALVEGNSKRPIYHVHKWWARRLGSVFRALILSSALPSTETVTGFWDKYYNGLSLRGRTLYDPMMGGGVTIFEGLRLGCKVIGVDVNPVAWFITKKEVEPLDQRLVQECYDRLVATVGAEVRRYYATKCPKNHNAEVVYALWIRQVKCVKCREIGDLKGTAIIRERVVRGKKESKILRVVTCAKCGAVFETSSEQPRCPECGSSIHFETDTLKGTYKCNSCQNIEKITEAVRRKGSFLSSRMFAIQYFCSICGTGFKKPTKSDLALYDLATKELKARKDTLMYPKQRIPIQGRSDKRPVSHGYKKYYQLFNPRQLLSLALILREISCIPDKSAREFLLLTFSSSLETNNVLCKYESKWGKVSALFGIPGYHVPNRCGENNVLGRGRGSFVRSFEKMKRGKKYAQRPYELLFDNDELSVETGRQKTYLTEYVSTPVTISGRQTQEVDQPLILCRDARKVPIIGSKSVDVVLTDPPYYDNFVYSELADFFYVWLRLVLKDDYPWFRGHSSRRNQEIVVNEKSRKGETRFVDSLAAVLKESKRVLRDDGLIVFTFHHSNPAAWVSLRSAIWKAGLYVTATPILRSEGKSGYRMGNINYDVCVVCRKGAPSKDAQGTNIGAENFLGECNKVVTELYQRDTEINESDILTAVMGQFLRSRSSATDDALGKIRDIVANLRSKLPVAQDGSESKGQEPLTHYISPIGMSTNVGSSR